MGVYLAGEHKVYEVKTMQTGDRIVFTLINALVAIDLGAFGWTFF